MSFDEGFLAELFEATARSGLRVIVVGDAAAMLHGVPVMMTQHVDLMVREHPQLDASSNCSTKFIRPSTPTIS